MLQEPILQELSKKIVLNLNSQFPFLTTTRTLFGVQLQNEENAREEIKAIIEFGSYRLSGIIKAEVYVICRRPRP